MNFTFPCASRAFMSPPQVGERAPDWLWTDSTELLRWWWAMICPPAASLGVVGRLERRTGRRGEHGAKPTRAPTLQLEQGSHGDERYVKLSLCGNKGGWRFGQRANST